MIVVEKAAGKHIAYDSNESCIILGDDKDLTLNLEHREMDDPVTIDFCLDKNGKLTMGAANGLKYAATVEIPAREYETVEAASESSDEEDGPATTQEPVPFDMDKVTLYLYAID